MIQNCQKNKFAFTLIFKEKKKSSRSSVPDTFQMSSSLLYITHCQETGIVVRGAVILQIRFPNGICYVKLQEVLAFRGSCVFFTTWEEER